MIRNSKKTALLSRWPLFAFGIAVSTALTCIGVNVFCKPRENERIYAYATAYKADSNVFVSSVKEATSSKIRESGLRHGEDGKDETYRVFGAYYDSVDFYVLPYSWTGKIKTIAAHFDKETINALLPSSVGKNLLKDEDSLYGIQVYDKSSGTGVMEDIFTYTSIGSEDEDYYLCFRDKSVHINGLGEREDDEALKAVNHLLSK